MKMTTTNIMTSTLANTATRANVRRKKSGFTLIEVIAVLVVLGILAAVAVPSYVDLSDNARARAIDSGIAELNGRESLTWANQMLADGGYTDDATVFGAMNTTLEPAADWGWSAGPDENGGTLTFQTDTDVPLTRAASTATGPAVWSR